MSYYTCLFIYVLENDIPYCFDRSDDFADVGNVEK